MRQATSTKLASLSFRAHGDELNLIRVVHHILDPIGTSSELNRVTPALSHPQLRVSITKIKDLGFSHSDHGSDDVPTSVGLALGSFNRVSEVDASTTQARLASAHLVLCLDLGSGIRHMVQSLSPWRHC